MRLTHVSLSGFRGYRDNVRVDLAPGFTVIDGRNGTGKSTIFDAIEYALTGELTKYGEAKAAGQTVADYLWWRGIGSPPEQRSVEIGLEHEGRTYTLKRTPVEGPPKDVLAAVTAAMVDAARAPSKPLEQLCAASIIRDEHIARLSLDLSETQRYALLREAIGASDADDWTARAHQLQLAARKRHETARNEVVAATAEVANANRRVDEVRASLSSDAAISEAVAKLGALTGSRQPADQIASIARERIAKMGEELARLEALLDARPTVATAQSEIPRLEIDRTNTAAKLAVAREHREALPEPALQTPAEQSARVRELLDLLRIGRALGPLNGHCPLCAAEHDRTSFETGVGRAAAIVAEMDEVATRVARMQQDIRLADAAVDAAAIDVAEIDQRLAAARAVVETHASELASLGFTTSTSAEAVRARVDEQRLGLEDGRHALRVVETLRQNAEIERALRSQTEAGQRLARAQERAGRARRAEMTASALHDAARRSAAETLDLRLNRVLPLMSELYQRLRPHPYWHDIEYAIRGDVRRFLALQIADGLNPQFLFSSGQRRATGMAFLLSINLSLAWSRWRSILLDDPVQHVDDFRAVHLAEVLAQLVSGDRQVIVAVEDPALADMLCRRLPLDRFGTGRRVTLGHRASGTTGIESAYDVKPLVRRAFAALPSAQAG